MIRVFPDGPIGVDVVNRSSDGHSVGGARRVAWFETLWRGYEGSAIDGIEHRIFSSWKCSLRDQEDKGIICIEDIGRCGELSNGSIDELIVISELEGGEIRRIITGLSIARPFRKGENARDVAGGRRWHGVQWVWAGKSGDRIYIYLRFASWRCVM